MKRRWRLSASGRPRGARRHPAAADGSATGASTSAGSEIPPIQFVGYESLTSPAKILAHRARRPARGRGRRGRRGRGHARSHSGLRRVRRPGGGHGLAGRPAEGAARSSTRTTVVPSSSSTACAYSRGASTKTKTWRSPSSRRAAWACASTTPARTCSTPRCAGCSARTWPRPARWWRPTICASTSPTAARSRTARSSRSSDLVNEQVQANTPVTNEVMNIKEALASGAMALFGEKYGDRVRVVRIGDFSTELCGGTHLEQTGQIGLFKVSTEGAVAAGVRRIEAVTGAAALETVDSPGARAARDRRHPQDLAGRGPAAPAQAAGRAARARAPAAGAAGHGRTLEGRRPCGRRPASQRRRGAGRPHRRARPRRPAGGGRPAARPARLRHRGRRAASRRARSTWWRRSPRT